MPGQLSPNFGIMLTLRFERMIERRREHMEKRTENQLVTMMFNIDRSDPDRTLGISLKLLLW